MTTSTLDLMKAVTRNRGDASAIGQSHRHTPTAESGPAQPGASEPDAIRLGGDQRFAGANGTGPKRYPPMNLHSLPTGITRSLRFVSLFRREPHDPDTFHRFMAADTMRQVLEYRTLAGANAVDVGGGHGYVADALCEQQASCLVIEYQPGNLKHDSVPPTAVRGDAYALPVADASVDFVHSADLLPRVREPRSLIDEMVRVLKPVTGVGYVSFTNWYSPWGGHETSPWHYLGGRMAVRRYRRKHGRPPANEFGVNLHPLHIGDVLDWFAQHPELEIRWVGPRYWPTWTRAIIQIPGVREVITWNLVVVFGRKGGNEPGPAPA
jgi:SAM-dependent methyltransferase